MNTVNARLYVCGDCANKIKDAGLPKGAYRCPLIVDVINTDVVWDTTDATDCIREGRYQCICTSNADVELYKYLIMNSCIFIIFFFVTHY